MVRGRAASRHSLPAPSARPPVRPGGAPSSKAKAQLKKKPFAFARVRRAKCVSRKKTLAPGESVFFISPQTRTALRENTFDYDECVSGSIIYTYVLENPLSYVDQTGLDITVSFNGSAAAGAGHVGMGVNSPNTMGQRPQAGQNPVDEAIGLNVPGQISSDPNVDARVTIPTSPQQDKQAQQCIDKRTQEKQDYNLYKNNCAQFVEQCLSSAGVPVPNTFLPRVLFNNLQSRFGQGGQ